MVIFRFDNCTLDASKQELRRDGEPVHVEPQVLAVLQYLAVNGDRVVTKIELLDEVWGDRFVSESALTSRIKLARKACGDSGREQRILKTVHSRGYRFVVPVTIVDAGDPDPPVVAVSAPDASPEPDSAPRKVPPSARATTVVGRDAELEHLDRALADALQGRRSAVFVRGGIGIGKSTLVAEFLERQDLVDDWFVARGRCIRTRGGVEPYFALLDAFGQLARSDPGTVTTTLDRTAPAWLAQLPALLDHERHEQLQRRLLGSAPTRMLREGVDAIDALARVRPLALVLEDLHWADDCTLDVIDLLLQRPDPVPLLLIGTARPEGDELDAVLAPARAAGTASIIDLAPLDQEAIARLVSDRLGDAAPSSDVVSVVARRCGGVPLFAEEILTAWAATDRSATEDLDATIPPTLPPLIERRLTALGADEIELVQACAVAGDAFDVAAVAAGLGVPTADAERLLAAIARRWSVIVATGATSWPDGTVSAAYEFTHHLYREVILARITAGRRAELHDRIGRALEAGYATRAGEVAVRLASHFIQSGDVMRAVEHLLVAAERANDRDAHQHAIEFLDDALAHLDRRPDSAERRRAEARVRICLGTALVATRGWIDPSVSETYERALELCSDDPDCPEGAAARYGLATVSELRGQFERTETLLTPLLAGERAGHLAVEARELVACSTFHQGAFDRSLEHANTVLDSWDEETYSVLMARIAEHPASSCSSWSSLALWALGRFDESLRLAERAVELGERNRYALSTAVQQRAMLHQLRGEPGPTIEWAERCRQVGEDQNFPMRTIQADIYKGWALGAGERADEGVTLIADGLARFRDAGATLNEAYYLGMYAATVLRLGQHARALELLETARERATSRTYFYDAELWRLTAQAHLAAGGDDALDRARTALDRSQSTARDQGSIALELRTVADRVELEAEFGDPAEFRGRLAELLGRVVDQTPTPAVERAAVLVVA